MKMVISRMIYPRLIGRGIYRHPLAAILAILCGAELAGISYGQRVVTLVKEFVGERDGLRFNVDRPAVSRHRNDH